MDETHSNELNVLKGPKRQFLSSSSSVLQAPVLATTAQSSGRTDALLIDSDDLFSSDKHDMMDRIFNFYKETVHRFPSPHQDQLDEDLLNRLILQCIGTTSRPAPWNRPSIYVSPYTPIKPSKMHINDLPKDCIVHLLEQFMSLHELVSKAFVCSAWVPAVAKIISGRIHSLKVFDSEENIELYQETALMKYNLARLDLAAGVRQTGERKDDHIFARSFHNDEKNLGIFGVLFAKVNYLVLHTVNIDHAGLIRCMDKLTSITLLELPDSDKQQNAIWEALNAAPELRHVHIFSNGDFLFEADKMDFLTRIESFTLDNYTLGNLFDILNRLSPQLRCLQIGPFAQGDELLERLIEENPDMVANLTQLSVQLDEKSMSPGLVTLFNEPYEESYLVHKKMLQLIVDHFTELTYLDMEFASLMFYTDVIDSLSKLLKLTELRFANRPKSAFEGFRIRLPAPSFLGRPKALQMLGVPNHRRQPTPLPNIKKLYLAKNSPYEDYPFLCRLFVDDQNDHVTRKKALQRALVQGNLAEANVPSVFPGIEQVTFVINGAIMAKGWTNFFDLFRRSMRRNVPPQYWLRLRLYNVTVGTMNEHFFASDEQDVAQNIKERNVLKNARRAGDQIDDDDHYDDQFRDAGDDDDDIFAMHRLLAAQELEANGIVDILNQRAPQNQLQRNIRVQAGQEAQNPFHVLARMIGQDPNARQGRFGIRLGLRQLHNERQNAARRQNREQQNPRQPNPRQPNPRQPNRRQVNQRPLNRGQPNRRQPNNPGSQFRRVNGRLKRA